MTKLEKPITFESVFGTYIVDELLGEGGSGRVYGGTYPDRTTCRPESSWWIFHTWPRHPGPSAHPTTEDGGPSTNAPAKMLPMRVRQDYTAL